MLGARARRALRAATLAGGPILQRFARKIGNARFERPLDVVRTLRVSTTRRDPRISSVARETAVSRAFVLHSCTHRRAGDRSAPAVASRRKCERPARQPAVHGSSRSASV